MRWWWCPEGWCVLYRSRGHRQGPSGPSVASGKIKDLKGNGHQKLICSLLILAFLAIMILKCFILIILNRSLSVRLLMGSCLWWVVKPALCLCQIMWPSTCSINKRSWSTPASTTYCMRKTETNCIKTCPKTMVYMSMLNVALYMFTKT